MLGMQDTTVIPGTGEDALASFVSVIQTTVACEEGTLTEELPPLHWPVEHFLDNSFCGRIQ